MVRTLRRINLLFELALWAYSFATTFFDKGKKLLKKLIQPGGRIGIKKKGGTDFWKNPEGAPISVHPFRPGPLSVYSIGKASDEHKTFGWFERIPPNHRRSLTAKQSLLGQSEKITG